MTAAPGFSVLKDLLSSQGDPRDLTSRQLQETRDVFEEETGAGLWLFCVYVCGLTKLTPTLHWEMCAFLSQWGKHGHQRLLMMVPRGSFKTSIGSKALPLWIATKDPESTVGIFNAAQDQAKTWVGSIRNILEQSVLYHMLWPERLPPGVHWRDREKGRTLRKSWRWGDAGLTLVRSHSAVSEPTFEAYGIGGSSTGKHYTHRIMDDLIGETAAQSPVIIEDAIHFVDHARALERPPNGGNELVNCTPWAYRDCYCMAPESRVWMADGSWRSIAELLPGDAVVGFRKVDRAVRPELVGKRGGARSRTELCFTKVVARASRPGALVTHLLEDGSTMRCTENHRFFKCWKSGRNQSAYHEGKGLTQQDYSEVKNLVRLRKVMDPFDACPDPFVAGWLGGMYDADGTYHTNTIRIYQSDKHYPDLCQKIRDVFDRLGIRYQEQRWSQTTDIRGNVNTSQMLGFNVTRREDRAKFLSWCKPTKHLERIRKSILGCTPFHNVRIIGRSEPELAEVFSIQTETGNYICEGLASSNSHLLNKWGEEYRVYRRSLLEHPTTGEPDVIDGVSIFPENIGTWKARRMAENDPFTFSSQYQCIPRAGRDVAFQRDWVRPVEYKKSLSGEPCLVIPDEHYDPSRVVGAVAGEKAPNLIPLHWCDRAILIDPAPTKRGEKSSEPLARTGIVVVAVDPWGRCYTLQSVPLREDPVTILNAVVMLSVYWKCHKVGIEEVNFSSVYAPLWNIILRQRHPDIEIRWISLYPKGEDKDTRIRGLLGGHREGLWYYYGPRTHHVVQELLEFPNGETRDLIDAQAYWRQALNRPQTPTEQEQNYYSQSQGGRDAYTGY